MPGLRVACVWVLMLYAAPLDAAVLHQAPTAAPAPAVAVALLTQGVVVERPPAPAESHVFGITLDAGELADVSIDRLGIDVIVSIVAPDGQVIEQIDELSEHESPERILVLGRRQRNVPARRAFGEREGRIGRTVSTHPRVAQAGDGGG